MITINVMLFLAMLESAVVFLILWLWWFFKNRKLERQIVALQAQTKPELSSESAPDAQDYIIQELGTTHAQLGVQSETSPELSTAPLTLRAAYLDLEREFAQSQERDSEFWEGARERLTVLLEEFTPPAPAPVAAEPAESINELFAEPDDEVSDDAGTQEHEPQRVKQLIETHVTTITELKDVIEAMVGGQERGPEVVDRVEKLGRASRELAMCVSILEDDNNMLRDRLTKAGILAE